MALNDELLTLERGFWDAVGDPEYYRANMADDGLAVFSMGVMNKDAAITATSGEQMTKWTDVALSNAQLVQLTPESALLVYEGAAKRDGEPYAANCSTVYVKRGKTWQMALHQQSAKSE